MFSREKWYRRGFTCLIIGFCELFIFFMIYTFGQTDIYGDNNDWLGIFALIGLGTGAILMIFGMGCIIYSVLPHKKKMAKNNAILVQQFKEKHEREALEKEMKKKEKEENAANEN